MSNTHEAPPINTNVFTQPVTSSEWAPQGKTGSWMQMGAVGLVCVLLAWQTITGERNSQALQNTLIESLRSLQDKQMNENRENRNDLKDLVKTERDELGRISERFNDSMTMQREHDTLKHESILLRMDKYQQAVIDNQKAISEVQVQINKVLTTNQKTMEAVIKQMQNIEAKH